MVYTQIGLNPWYQRYKYCCG